MRGGRSESPIYPAPVTLDLGRHIETVAIDVSLWQGRRPRHERDGKTLKNSALKALTLS